MVRRYSVPTCVLNMQEPEEIEVGEPSVLEELNIVPVESIMIISWKIFVMDLFLTNTLFLKVMIEYYRSLLIMMNLKS